MPNIFKSFLKPAVNSYVFPDAESLQVEESPEPEGEQAEETPLQEQEPEAPHTAAADALNYAKIQAEKILEDARQQAEELLEQERQRFRQRCIKPAVCTRILQRALQTRQLFFQIHNPYPGLTLRRQARSSALRAHSPPKSIC